MALDYLGWCNYKIGANNKALEYYNDELKEIIAETRKGDIETFGFTFEKNG